MAQLTGRTQSSEDSSERLASLEEWRKSFDKLEEIRSQTQLERYTQIIKTQEAIVNTQEIANGRVSKLEKALCVLIGIWLTISFLWGHDVLVPLFKSSIAPTTFTSQPK
jgi:fatty acid-binding protein DegV